MPSSFQWLCSIQTFSLMNNLIPLQGFLTKTSNVINDQMSTRTMWSSAIFISPYLPQPSSSSPSICIGGLGDRRTFFWFIGADVWALREQDTEAQSKHEFDEWIYIRMSWTSGRLVAGRGRTVSWEEMRSFIKILAGRDRREGCRATGLPCCHSCFFQDRYPGLAQRGEAIALMCRQILMFFVLSPSTA